jgi:hypothetical protein
MQPSFNCPTSHTPPLVGSAHTLRISSSQGLCLLSGILTRGSSLFHTLGHSLLHLHTCKMRVPALTAVSHNTFSPWAVRFSRNQPLTSHTHTPKHTPPPSFLASLQSDRTRAPPPPRLTSLRALRAVPLPSLPATSCAHHTSHRFPCPLLAPQTPANQLH